MQNTSGESPPVTGNSLIHSLREWCELIKIEHTVFALPFALSGLILASGTLPDIKVVVFTIIAFAGARAAAMSLNRAIDAEIDRRNPRTAERSVPKGTVKKTHVIAFAIISFAVMALAASQLPEICLKLSPVAIVWLSIYSFTKRFTWLCHFVLGIALGGAALGGWLAAGGSLLTPSPWLLAFAVSTWVAGFDLIYAMQDIDVDRKEKLFSIPAVFGGEITLVVSNLLHILTVISLVLLGLTVSVGMFYWIGVSIVTAMLIYEHAIVKPNDLSRINAAFFEINGFVSILMFLTILIDRLIRT
jgi:4-hydroxybenzoate polyprenyltransferase